MSVIIHLQKVLGVVLLLLPTAISASSQYDSIIQEAAVRYGVDPGLIKAVIKQESGFVNGLTSSADAMGLMQLIPATADRFGVNNPWDPRQNIMGGTAYLSWLLNRFNGDVRLALAGYNAGEGTVDKYGGIPPYAETQNYVRSVLGHYARFGGSGWPASGGATGGTVELVMVSLQEVENVFAAMLGDSRSNIAMLFVAIGVIALFLWVAWQIYSYANTFIGNQAGLYQVGIWTFRSIFLVALVIFVID